MSDPEDDDIEHDATASTWRSARVAQALSECLDTTALFAAPRAFERWRSSKSRHGRPSKEKMLAQLAELGELFQAEPEILGKGAMQQAPTLFAEMRRLLEGWDGDSAPGPELTAHARATLAALGLPEPQGGWDDYLPDA